jgi:hypothetical protein
MFLIVAMQQYQCTIFATDYEYFINQAPPPSIWHLVYTTLRLAQKLNGLQAWGHIMRNKLLSGTACAALCLVSFGSAARSATLDDVMARLDKIEKENAELRAKVKALSAGRPVVVTPVAVAPASTDPSKFTGNPVLHGAVATSPAPVPPPVSRIAGIPVKAGPLAPLIDNTTVTLYGSIDVSGDIFNPSVYDQGTKLGIASNISSFGIRVRHNLTPYGWDG